MNFNLALTLLLCFAATASHSFTGGSCLTRRFADVQAPLCPIDVDPMHCGVTTYKHAPGSDVGYLLAPKRVRQVVGNTHQRFVCGGTPYGDIALPYRHAIPGSSGFGPFEGTINPCCPCYGANPHDTLQDTSGCEDSNGNNPASADWTTPTQICYGDQAWFNYLGSVSPVIQAIYALNGSAPWNPSQQHLCYCRTTNYTLITEHLVGGVWIQAQESPTTGCFVPISHYEPPEKPIPWGLTSVGQFNKRDDFYDPVKGIFDHGIVTRHSIRDVPHTLVSLDDQELIVTTPYPSATTITITKDGLIDRLLCTLQHCVNVVPDEFYINPGTLVVRIFINDTQDRVDKLPIESFVRCNVPRCIFCQSMVHDFKCFPWQFQMFIILVSIVAVLASILLLWKIITSARRTQCCKGCGKKVNNIWVATKRKISRKPSQSSGVDMTKFGNMEDEDFVEESESAPSVQPTRKLSQIVFLVLLFAPLLALGQPCASGVTVSGTNLVCYVDGTTETCQFEFSAIVGVPAPGLSACLSFRNGEGDPIGSMEIHYDRMLMIAPLQHLYATSNWQGNSFSDKQCPWEHMCGDCSQYNPLTDPLACQGTTNCLMPEYMGQWKGESLCSSQCGCAGCGCFACSSSCVYSRAVIIPYGPFCNVLRPIAIYRRPQITVNFTTANSQFITPIDVQALSTQVGDNFTVTIQGTLQANDIILNEKVLRCNNGFSGFGFASDPNAPVVRSVGDIQANSIADFAPGGLYTYAPGLFQAQPTATVTNYLFQPSGYTNSAPSFNSFPTMRGAIHWSDSGSNMYGDNYEPGQLLMTVSSAGPVTMSRTVNVVCPKIISANLTGCYSCAQGATITVIARSRCSVGHAVATLSETGYTVSTPTVILQTEDSTHMIRFTSPVSIVTFELILTSGSQSDKISVTGTLVAEDLVGFANGTYISNGTDSPTSVNVPGIFIGLPNWASGIILAVIVVAALVGSIILFKCLFNAYKSYKSNKMEAQYMKLSESERKERMAASLRASAINL